MAIDAVLASVAVKDLNIASAWNEQLDAMGVDTTQQSSDSKIKTVMVTDPDGNHISFAEASDSTLDRGRTIVFHTSLGFVAQPIACCLRDARALASIRRLVRLQAEGVRQNTT